MMQLGDSIFCFILFSQLSTVAYGIPQKNQDDALKKVCIDLFRGSDTSSDHSSQPQSPYPSQHKSLRGYQNNPKVSISRANTVGQAGQIINYNLIGTDQATHTGGNIVTTQQNIGLIDSIAKYVEASIILPVNLKRNADPDEHSTMLKSKSLSLQSDSDKIIESLMDKCKNFVDTKKIPIDSKRTHPIMQSSTKNSRESFSQEPKGTLVQTKVNIGPDGDYTDVVSSATDNSTATETLLGQFDQNHFKMVRSSGDIIKITSAIGIS